MISKALLALCVAASLTALRGSAGGAAQSAVTNHRSTDLRVYFVDVEGGQATLFVAPGGASLLVDTGWPGNNGRDADRIVAAAKQANLSRIDYVLITHFHEDHVGGVAQLVQRIPVGTFLDHGELYEHIAVNEQLHTAYEKVLATGKYGHQVLHAGDKLPVPGLDAIVLASDDKVLAQPLPGAGQPNSLCAADAPPAKDTTENGHSLGFLLTFAGVRILDLGDLTKDNERLLVCPRNRIGHVDIDIVSHHGWEQSSSRSFVHALAPRITIMDNGAKKGGSAPVLDVVRTSPSLETAWQLHTSEEGLRAGPQLNTADDFIANPGTQDGFMLELTVHPDGTFAVKNDRTGTVKRYSSRK